MSDEWWCVGEPDFDQLKYNALMANFLALISDRQVKSAWNKKPLIMIVDYQGNIQLRATSEKIDTDSDTVDLSYILSGGQFNLEMLGSFNAVKGSEVEWEIDCVTGYVFLKRWMNSPSEILSIGIK